MADIHASDGHAAPASRAHEVGARPAHRARTRGPAAVLLFTVLGTILPGLGLIVAGWRKLGLLILLVGIGAAVYLAVRVGGDPVGAAETALVPGVLNAIIALSLAIGLAWAVLVVCTYRALRPAGDTRLHRGVMSVVVGLLCLLVLAPTSYAAQLTFTTQQTVNTIFGQRPGSATVPTAASTGSAKDPWADQPRLNVLLLGGDAGPTAGGGIRRGLRTDSVVVASIDTHTGNTVLVSVPRNLEHLQFPPESPLGKVYPNGYHTANRGDQDLLNTVYDEIPAVHPGLLGTTDNEGADALKIGLGYSLGVSIDYYVVVSLTGFEQVVNALGGVTVNVNEPVADGGTHEPGQPDTLPRRWIMPGPNQHLTGRDAEWFSRGRYGTDDNARIRRQRCTINALVNQASPARVLASYQTLADTAANVTKTDISTDRLSKLVQLGDTIKQHGTISSLVIDNGALPGLSMTNPDFDRIRAAVETAIKRNAGGSTGAGPTSQAASPGSSPSPIPTATQVPVPTPTSSSAPKIENNLNDTCAYQPDQVAAALADWKATFGAKYTDQGLPR